MTENEIKMVKELQESYEYHWINADYDYCDKMIGVFCIINKYLTGNTGWRIRFDGSKADELLNPRTNGYADNEQNAAIRFCHEHKLLMIPVDSYHRLNVAYYAFQNGMTYEDAEKAILENDYLKGASE